MDMAWQGAYILSSPLPLLLSARSTSLHLYVSLCLLYAFRYLFIYITDISPSPRRSPTHSVNSLIIFLDFNFVYCSVLLPLLLLFLYVLQTLLRSFFSAIASRLTLIPFPSCSPIRYGLFMCCWGPGTRVKCQLRRKFNSHAFGQKRNQRLSKFITSRLSRRLPKCIRSDCDCSPTMAPGWSRWHFSVPSAVAALSAARGVGKVGYTLSE